MNENAFAPIVRARPCPTFGRPVCHRGRPHRLRPGTSPHALRIPPRDGHPALRSVTSSGCRSALAVSSFRRRARLDFSIPSTHSGQRGVTPAFGYGTPHPSAGGTSTLLICALPGAHYGPIRHLARPSPSLAGGLLSATAHDSTHPIRLPVLRTIPCLRQCCRHYPGGPVGCICRSLLPQHRPSPSLWWVGTHV